MSQVCELDSHSERFFCEPGDISLTRLALSVCQGINRAQNALGKASLPKVVKRQAGILHNVMQQRRRLSLFGTNRFSNRYGVLNIVLPSFINLPAMRGGCQPKRL